MLIWLYFFLIESHFIMKLQFLFENNFPVKRQKKFVLPQSCVTDFRSISMFSGFNKMTCKDIRNKKEIPKQTTVRREDDKM